MYDDDTNELTPGEEAITILKRRWGAGFEKRLQDARYLCRRLGPDFVEALDETGAGDDYRIIIGIERLARALDDRGRDVEPQEEEQRPTRESRRGRPILIG